MAIVSVNSTTQTTLAFTVLLTPLTSSPYPNRYAPPIWLVQYKMLLSARVRMSNRAALKALNWYV